MSQKKQKQNNSLKKLDIISPKKNKPTDPRKKNIINSNNCEEISILKLKVEQLIEFKNKYFELKDELNKIELYKDEFQDELINTIDELQSIQYHYNTLKNNYDNVCNELNLLKNNLRNYTPIKQFICNKCAFPGHNQLQCKR